MKSKFSTFAPILALALLASAGSAYKYGKEFEAKTKVAKDAEGVARAELDATEVALAEVRALSFKRKHETRNRNLELAQGVAALMTMAKKNGIKIGAIGSSGAAGANTTPMESVFSPVPMTDGKVQRADVVLKADYETYEGFLRFFEEVRSSGMAIQSVTIKNSTFDSVIRVMGV